MNNKFTGDPNASIGGRKVLSNKSSIDMDILQTQNTTLTKGPVVVNFVHVNKKFTGTIQVKIDHEQKIPWYNIIKKEFDKNDRINMRATNDMFLIEYPISIVLEEDEKYDDVLDDIYRVIMDNKPSYIKIEEEKK